MKIESFDHALPYFSKQWIRGKKTSGNIPELRKSESESDQIEDLIESTLLRWADDGGQTLDPDSMTAGSNPKLSGVVR